MIQEKYKAKTIDEILDLIEVDKKKYNANEKIVKKEIKRGVPMFWKKSYVYSVEYTTKGEKPLSKTKQKNVTTKSNEKDMILEMLNQPVKKEDFNIGEYETKHAKVEQKQSNQLLEEYENRLLEAEVKQEVVQQIINQTKKELNEVDYENREKVEEEIMKQMTEIMGDTYRLKLTETKKIVLIGPTGVGKTTTIGKIAGILVSQGKKVGFITTDVYRIGATHQLDIYAKIVNSTMEAANSPKELEEAIYYFENVEKVDHILIDTVGRSPMDAGNIEDMKSYLEVAKPDHISLVLSCTQKEKDIYKIIDNFEKANVNSVIFTKLDETMQHGTVLNVIADKKTNVSFITNGQDVPQDIYVANTDKMAGKILKGVDDFERPSI